MNQMEQKLPAAISTKSMCFLHASEQVIGRNIHLNNAVNKRKTQEKKPKHKEKGKVEKLFPSHRSTRIKILTLNCCSEDLFLVVAFVERDLFLFIWRK